jgi:hypothetical protein
MDLWLSYSGKTTRDLSGVRVSGFLLNVQIFGRLTSLWVIQHNVCAEEMGLMLESCKNNLLGFGG